MTIEKAIAAMERVLEYRDNDAVWVSAGHLRAVIEAYRAAKRDIEALLAQDEWEGKCWACAKLKGTECLKGCKPEWRGPEPGGEGSPPDNYIGEQPVAYGAPFDEPFGEA